MSAWQTHSFHPTSSPARGTQMLQHCLVTDSIVKMTMHHICRTYNHRVGRPCSDLRTCQYPDVTGPSSGHTHRPTLVIKLHIDSVCTKVERLRVKVLAVRGRAAKRLDETNRYFCIIFTISQSIVRMCNTWPSRVRATTTSGKEFNGMATMPTRKYPSQSAGARQDVDRD